MVGRNGSPHWRCLGAVPFTSFSEFNKDAGGDIWFALDESRPLACFAGMWTNWTSVRKVREGETTNDIFGFLTTDANVEVRTSKGDAGDPDNARRGRHLDARAGRGGIAFAATVPDGALQIVARGVKKDGVEAVV